MRTKALLLSAVIGAASLATSMAQVYSVNIVGYINIPLAKGWNLIANQLNNSGGNTVANLMPSPPGAISVFTYDSATQNYNNANFLFDIGIWDTPDMTLNPGQGVFINTGDPADPATVAFTLTLVGEVQTGTTPIALVGGWQLLSVVVPQGGVLADQGDGQPHLEYVPSPEGDSLFSYDSTTQQYNNFNYLGDIGIWDTPPVIEVGKGFFAQRSSAGTWTRTFNVGP